MDMTSPTDVDPVSYPDDTTPDTTNATPDDPASTPGRSSTDTSNFIGEPQPSALGKALMSGYDGPNPYTDLPPHLQYTFDAMAGLSKADANTSFYFAPQNRAVTSDEFLEQALQQFGVTKGLQSSTDDFGSMMTQTLMPRPPVYNADAVNEAYQKANTDLSNMPERQIAPLQQPNALQTGLAGLAAALLPSKAFDLLRTPLAWGLQSQATKQAYLDSQYMQSVQNLRQKYNLDLDYAQNIAQQQRMQFEASHQDYMNEAAEIWRKQDAETARQDQWKQMGYRAQIEASQMDQAQTQKLNMLMFDNFFNPNQDPGLQGIAAAFLKAKGFDIQPLSSLTQDQQQALMRTVATKLGLEQTKVMNPLEVARAQLQNQGLGLENQGRVLENQGRAIQNKYIGPEAMSRIGLAAAQTDREKAETADIPFREGMEQQQFGLEQQKFDGSQDAASTKQYADALDMVQSLKADQAKADEAQAKVAAEIKGNYTNATGDVNQGDYQKALASDPRTVLYNQQKTQRQKYEGHVKIS